MTGPVLGVADFPLALTVVAWSSLGLGAVCGALLLVDVVRHPPAMRIMAAVWPLTALFGGPLWVVMYARWARAGGAAQSRRTPRAVSIAISTSHCGAGCALADLVVEWLVFAVPALAVAGGLGTVFHDRIFAVWVLELVVAFLVGIAFQYAAIVPARGLGVAAGVRAAIAADTASIVAWQCGMYGLMAVLQLLLLPLLFGGRASVATPEFWFAMQFAMLAGFAVAYPVIALLIRSGLKEAM
jgi:hypothetical protein